MRRAWSRAAPERHRFCSSGGPPRLPPTGRWPRETLPRRPHREAAAGKDPLGEPSIWYNCVFTQNRAALARWVVGASQCTTVSSHRTELLWRGGLWGLHVVQPRAHTHTTELLWRGGSWGPHSVQLCVHTEQSCFGIWVGTSMQHVFITRSESAEARCVL